MGGDAATRVEAVLPQRRTSGKSEESTLAVVGVSEGPPPLEDSPTIPLCCLLQSHRRGQRLLKVTFTDQVLLLGWTGPAAFTAPRQEALLALSSRQSAP